MKEKNSDNLHYSVMKEESLCSLKLTPGLTVVDATVNRAGHAEVIAKQIGETGTLVIVDLDKKALTFSKTLLESIPNHPRIIAIHSNYRFLKENLLANGITSVDRIFADLGLSSQELEISGRGFSFQKDEPLYMTFQSEVDKNTFTGIDLINNLSVSSLEKIFQVYGDEPFAWKIANAIVNKRDELLESSKSKHYPLKIETTKQLVDIIESVVPRKGKTHPATKVFQAIRIAVNDEFESIKQFVSEGYKILNIGGILSVITFHSGEDRIVKNMFASYVRDFKDKKVLNQKFKPSRKEVVENKRSRSAILRTIIKKTL